MRTAALWIRKFLGWYLFISLGLLAYPPFPAWTEGLGTDPVVVLAWLGLVIVVFVGIAGAHHADQQWAAWRKQFRHADPASKLDAQTIVGNVRRMDQPYTPAARALQRPITLQTSPDHTPRAIAADADRYLSDTLRKGRLGVLLQGRPLLGKTRLLVEWLRREHPRWFVLAPEPGAPLPDLHPALDSRLRHGACLLLDDLDRFEDHMPGVLTSLHHLKQRTEARGAPFAVLATVRDGGPSQTVEGPAFRLLYQGLEHLELVPPTPEHMRATADHAPGDERPGDERSFAFLLGEQFEVQSKHYRQFRDSTSPAEVNAARWLRAAKALDDRGIALRPDRLRSVAQALFEFEPTHAEPAHAVLRRFGFTDAGALEPAFLRNIVPTSGGDLDATLDAHLRAHHDARAFVAWGVRDYFSDRPADAQEWFKLAAKVAKASGAPGQREVAAGAEFNLGFLLGERGDSDGERATYGAAIADGRAAGTPDGLVQAAKAGVNLGDLLHKHGDYQGAQAASEAAISDGRAAGTPDGLVQASKAGSNLGNFLSERGYLDTAAAAYEAAIADGRSAGTPEGLARAAVAGFNLGVLLGERSDPDDTRAADDARAAYEAALADGRAAGTPDGLVQAAMAGFNLGNLLSERGDLGDARAAYEAALADGHAAGTLDGREAVDRAERALALLDALDSPPGPAPLSPPA